MIEPGVRLIGNVQLGKNVSIAAPAEVMAKDSLVSIGDECDIAGFVTISTADSHDRCIGRATKIERKPITIQDHVFIGTGAVILGGCHVGHHTVIGAGVVIKNRRIPPYSLVTTPQAVVLHGWFKR